MASSGPPSHAHVVPHDALAVKVVRWPEPRGRFTTSYVALLADNLLRSPLTISSKGRGAPETRHKIALRSTGRYTTLMSPQTPLETSVSLLYYVGVGPRPQLRPPPAPSSSPHTPYLPSPSPLDCRKQQGSSSSSQPTPPTTSPGEMSRNTRVVPVTVIDPRRWWGWLGDGHGNDLSFCKKSRAGKREILDVFIV